MLTGRVGPACDDEVPSPSLRQAESSPSANGRDAVREAMTLPWLFLAATALASVEITGARGLAFSPPSLMALILGLLLVGLFVQSGVAHLPSLVSSHRGGLENATGIVVLVLLLLVSAQVLKMLTPSRGLFSFVVATYFLFLLLTTFAARPDPERVLRCLAMTFGGALVLKFVVLSGMASPRAGFVKKVTAAAVEGLTLGAIGADYHAPAAGYLAFAALVLLFVGLWLLPKRDASGTPLG